MKISELIAALAEMLKQHGDVIVEAPDTYPDDSDYAVSQVGFDGERVYIR